MKKNHLFQIILIVSLFFIPSLSNARVLHQKATLAGGCFWCMEAPFEKLDGVLSVISGFSGGDKVHPKYQEVASGKTKHRESVQISFDANKISYEKILEIYWQQINPTDDQGQFVDRGHQYSPAIFYHDEAQKKMAEKSKQDLINQKIFDQTINVPIIEYQSFYPAEEYHQDYYQKNPIRYKFYRYRSGRDQFLEKYWKK